MIGYMVDVTELEANQTNLMQMEEEKFVEIFLNCRSEITDKNFIEILDSLVNIPSVSLFLRGNLPKFSHLKASDWNALKLDTQNSYYIGEINGEHVTMTQTDYYYQSQCIIKNPLSYLAKIIESYTKNEFIIKEEVLKRPDEFLSDLFHDLDFIFKTTKEEAGLNLLSEKLEVLKTSLLKFTLSFKKLLVNQIRDKGYYIKVNQIQDIKSPTFGLDLDWGKNKQLVAKFSNYISRNTEQNYIHGYGSRESFVIVQDLFSFTQKEIQAYFKKFAESENTLPRKAVFLAHADMYASSIDSYILKAHGSQSIETDDIKKSIKSNYTPAKIAEKFLSKLSLEMFS